MLGMDEFMTNYVIVEKDSNIIQENVDGMLCIFICRIKAEAFLRSASRSSDELKIIECVITKKNH